MEQYKIRRRLNLNDNQSNQDSNGEANPPAQNIIPQTPQPEGQKELATNQQQNGTKVRELYPQSDPKKDLKQDSKQAQTLRTAKSSSTGSSNHLVHLLLFLILLTNIAMFAQQNKPSEGQEPSSAEIADNINQLKETIEKYLPELSKIQISISEIQEKIVNIPDRGTARGANSLQSSNYTSKKINGNIKNETQAKPSETTFRSRNSRGIRSQSASRISKTTSQTNALKSESNSKIMNDSIQNSNRKQDTSKENNKQQNTKSQSEELNPPSIFDQSEEKGSSLSFSNKENVRTNKALNNNTLAPTHLTSIPAPIAMPIHCWQPKAKRCFLRK
ncbi:MAG: hypothetical protein SFU25_11450 [Candidatus Caenarcaniphilales bacterium]|nr:hypothetical protein [Candidatus Caenarcaniphilales bacterium]